MRTLLRLEDSQPRHARRGAADCGEHSPSCRSCCEGHRHLKPVSATKRAENGTGLWSIIGLRGATYAFVHACAARSCRADRVSCVLCSVPRRLSVARAKQLRPRLTDRSTFNHHQLGGELRSALAANDWRNIVGLAFGVKGATKSVAPVHSTRTEQVGSRQHLFARTHVDKFAPSERHKESEIMSAPNSGRGTLKSGPHSREPRAAPDFIMETKRHECLLITTARCD